MAIYPYKLIGNNFYVEWVKINVFLHLKQGATTISYSLNSSTSILMFSSGCQWKTLASVLMSAVVIYLLLWTTSASICLQSQGENRKDLLSSQREDRCGVLLTPAHDIHMRHNNREHKKEQGSAFNTSVCFIFQIYWVIRTPLTLLE